MRAGVDHLKFLKRAAPFDRLDQLLLLPVPSKWQELLLLLLCTGSLLFSPPCALPWRFASPASSKMLQRRP